jgi:hypothetical protein
MEADPPAGWPLDAAPPEVALANPQLAILAKASMSSRMGAKFCPPTETDAFASVVIEVLATRPWASAAPLFAC